MTSQNVVSQTQISLPMGLHLDAPLAQYLTALNPIMVLGPHQAPCLEAAVLGQCSCAAYTGSVGCTSLTSRIGTQAHPFISHLAQTAMTVVGICRAVRRTLDLRNAPGTVLQSRKEPGWRMRRPLIARAKMGRARCLPSPDLLHRHACRCWPLQNLTCLPSPYHSSMDLLIALVSLLYSYTSWQRNCFLGLLIALVVTPTQLHSPRKEVIEGSDGFMHLLPW